ncbi:MAG: thymidylate synthase [Patescibacteria group bacterium]|nr:thymidylate synthase [Patescibacteria group bacterium]
MKKSSFKPLFQSKNLLSYLDVRNIDYSSFNLVGKNVDELVLKGIKHILNNGEIIYVRAGTALQAYGVNYYLLNSRDRIHNIRSPKSVQYITREFIAYFLGSLKVDDGLSHASKFWAKLADENGCIYSNYGFYVFYQKVPGLNGKQTTQYQWCLDLLKKNLDTRRAIININQPSHKADSKDFPCTISIQFFTRIVNGKKTLCCEVKSRSTDVITGLPYDMGFFSFLLELIYTHLKEGNPKLDLELGYTTMQPTFTQIYDHGISRAKKIIESKNKPQNLKMPKIKNAKLLLKDIYNNSTNHDFIKWIHKYSK